MAGGVSAGIWGGLCALGFGSADFIARFSSVAIGHRNALLGTLAVGTLGLTLWVAVAAPPLAWPMDGVVLALVNGVTMTIALLLLYWGLARGPISVVAPIVAAHPVFIVALAVALGARPSALAWLAIAGTVLGGVLVAWGAESEQTDRSDRSKLATTIGVAALASVVYAAAISSGQASVPRLGELPALWLGRGTGLVALLVLFALRRERPRWPARWMPALFAQGVLDTTGFLFLFLGSGAHPEIAAVAASGFGAVTTLLAWLVLRERIGWVQGLGILMVFAGVAVLTAQG